MKLTGYGMQFTESLESSASCLFWFRWFEDRGVPAAIVQDGDNFAVFRKGVVKRRDESDLVCDAYTAKFVDQPRVIISCNGYTNPQT